jgi:hypothetical protein
MVTVLLLQQHQLALLDKQQMYHPLTSIVEAVMEVKIAEEIVAMLTEVMPTPPALWVGQDLRAENHL